MKTLLLAAGLAVLFIAPAFAQGIVLHRGYVTRDGIYHVPHYQTAPNGTRLDNWSTQGNSNPFTGRRGTEPVWPMPTWGGMRGGYR